ncbi:MAG: S-layer homology domain-containing protein [Clostridia bacterium]|nr:S-layer homology domain-containing protein [Clostridia bacterium]
MRNLKKFLALVLAMLMVLSMAVITTGAASDDADYSDAANHLAALKILKGDEKGNLNLDNGVTRWQAALFFVQALTGKTDAKTWNADRSAYFTDVPEYGTAIDYAYGINLIVGRGNGVYGYADAITYQDMLVMAVRALGYETDNMVYPQGYTLAANKLGLTDNIDVTVDFRDTLTRGETAQIIWDMLQTEVAITDPINGNIVYPNETSSLELILSATQGEAVKIDRTTLLEESNFADGKITGTITAFVEADEDENDYEEDMVVVDTDSNDLTLVAADLGITAETKPTTYLGLDVTLYVDCAAEDFAEEYEDGDAMVVFADYDEYTVVENIGATGNIKRVVNAKTASKSYYSLGGTKFTDGKYDVALKVWDNTDGWVDATEAEATAFENSFLYDDGEYVGAGNTYGKVAYRVIEAEDDEDLDVVEVLYTEYYFGQYNVLTTKDSTTSKNADFATYTDGFAEQWYLFGTDKKVSDTTSSVSKTYGEKAKTVTVEGEEIESGDFMFYAYNAADNVLTVVKNCGTYAHGRLTGYSDSKETAKIGGVSYKFGFDGLYTAAGQTAYNRSDIVGYIEALEKGENNVKYLAVDGKLVYVGDPDEDESGSAGAFDFVIATTDKDIVADLLEIDADVYEDALVGAVDDVTDGVYVDDDGYVAIAVLDLTTGQWTLGSLKSLAISYDLEDEKFTTSVDLATYAKFAEIGQLADDVQAKYNAAAAALESNLFALVSEKDGVYTLAANTTYGYEAPVAPETVAKPEGYDTLTDEQIAASTDEAVKAYTQYLADKEEYDKDNAEYLALTDKYAPFATAPAAEGVIFNTTGRTNRLSVPNADKEDYETIRISMAADTVVVALFSDGAVGVRVGATKNDSNNKYNVVGGANSVLLSATSKLIVIDTEKTSDNGAGLSMDLDVWNTTNIGGTVTYYVVTAHSEIESEKNDDGEIVYNVTDVYDTKANTFTDITTTSNLSDLKIGDVLYLRSTGSIDATSSSKTGALFTANRRTMSLHQALQGIYNGSAKTRIEGANTAANLFDFVDEETLIVKKANGAIVHGSDEPLGSVSVKALMLNFFATTTNVGHDNYGKDQDDYDFEAMVLATPIARYADIAKEVETDEYADYIDEGIDLIELNEDEVALYVGDAAVEGQEYYFVTYALMEEGYTTCNEPTEGVFNNFMVNNSTATLLVPTNDADDYTDAAKVQVYTGVSTTAQASTAAGATMTVFVSHMLVDDGVSVAVKAGSGH